MCDTDLLLPSLRYSIEKKEKLGTRWVKCGKTSGPDCKYRVTDVIEGTEVQFQVLAENEAGTGHPSEPTEILTIEDPTGQTHEYIHESGSFNTILHPWTSFTMRT